MNDDSGFLVEALLSPNLWAMGNHKMMRIQENEFLIMVDWLLTCNFQVDVYYCTVYCGGGLVEVNCKLSNMESNQNISGSGPLPSSTVDEQGVQPQGIETNTQQPMVTPAVPATKKRKEIGQSKKHGTSSLRNHIMACLKNPHSNDTRQSLLTFNAVSTSGTNAPEGVLGTWVFDQEAIRRALCEMIIIDELPFRWTISRDIYQIFLDERLSLRKLFRVGTQRVSFTTDTWTSVQRINYMCITAHFIDDQWKLQKKIISFVPISSHRGEYIAKALESCLLEWGIRNVFTITVDNASSNDTTLGYFKSKLLSWGCSSVRLQYLHMRCIAHILNLVVQDGLKYADESVKRVRDAVRWVRNSPARLQKFRELADLIGVEAKSTLHLDVPTRWNSTYIMLNTAIEYQRVFDMLAETDPSFSADLDDVPCFLDWSSVESLVKLLKTFYEMTVRISGSLYVTSNTFFSEISDLSCMLEDMVLAEPETDKVMGQQMKTKFHKYWGDPAKMNFLIFYANILDPRDKEEYMPHQFVQLYGEENGKSFFAKVQTAMSVLYADYASTYSVSSTPSESSTQSVQSEATSIGRPQSRLKSQLKKKRMEGGGGSSKQTELQVYLSESIVEDDEDATFDVLKWWKGNSERFPILSKMARDVLAVPISTVASESAFSTSGRVLDPFRSSLTPKIVEALLCTQDWLRLPNQAITVEKNLDEVERLEKELATGCSIPSMLSSIPLVVMVMEVAGKLMAGRLGKRCKVQNGGRRRAKKKKVVKGKRTELTVDELGELLA
ncbi:zinc finger BED domain-containing protein RICESLEEPER 2-like [Ipomoea triloba]|uniref:zinc finger BED domain-containing protein RICESLEEPER 2-like n=1 Tax=Ipomoea triloba TaxID=35885 RepID=UPI00125DDBB7|nr:zinc finger BED domain-containing protein RICESLEEPER 2-like [Ipomoea triloba]